MACPCGPFTCAEVGLAASVYAIVNAGRAIGRCAVDNVYDRWGIEVSVDAQRRDSIRGQARDG